MVFKQTLKRLVESRGWTLARTAHLPGLVYNRDQVRFLQSRGIDVVFDVGANVGQFGTELRQIGYQGDILSFEPIPTAFAELRVVASRDARWATENVGLGEKAGELVLNVSRATVFSSFVAQTSAAEAFASEAETATRIQVPVRKLDDYLSHAQGRRAFIKIDTQGFEEQVLKGGDQMLELALGVQLEVPIVHLYEGVWRMEEALAFMREKGFVPAQFRPVNIIGDDPSCLEVDCVFRRF